MNNSDFPRYEMIINGKREFLRFAEAVRAYDTGFVRVEFGELIMQSDFSTRPMTDAEKVAISDAAEEYSASK